MPPLAFDFAGFKKHIEANADSYVARLGEAVAIDGVSGDVSRRPKVCVLCPSSGGSFA
jgi:hypothetical protein